MPIAGRRPRAGPRPWRSPPRCAPSACGCGPARRGAARPAPCGPGCAGSTRRRRRARRARRAPRGTRRSRRRGRSPAPVELEDPGRDPVEQVAVVGDEHQPAAEVGQPVLQPGDAVDVEVVGGLVEDEQVAAGATRVRASATRLAWPPDSVASVGVGQPAQADAVERGRDLPGLRRPRRPRRRVHAPRRRPGRVPSSGRWSRAATRTPRPRRTVPDSGSALAGQDPQQGGLAGAVEADDAEPVARRER